MSAVPPDSRQGSGRVPGPERAVAPDGAAPNGAAPNGAALDGAAPDGGASTRGQRTWWTLVQLALLAIVLLFIVAQLVEQQEQIRAAAASLEVKWGWVAASSGLVLLTYAALIQSWRLLMAGWGSTLGYGAAVRVWTIANLGRYVPGKVWSVGALVVLARREGVNPVAATGAALLGTLLNIGAGCGVIALSGDRVLDVLDPRYRVVTVVGSAGFIAGVIALPWLLPRLLKALARFRPQWEQPSRPLSPGVLWTAVAINCASWVGYGLAFLLFTRGVLPATSGALPAFVAIWTASYLVGYLTLIAPGGIGVRDAALTLALVALGLASSADAVVLVILSRLWLTALEVLPGLLSLLLAPAVRRASS